MGGDVERETSGLLMALEAIAGERQCLDNLMSNAEIAADALTAYRAALAPQPGTDERRENALLLKKLEPAVCDDRYSSEAVGNLTRRLWSQISAALTATPAPHVGESGTMERGHEGGVNAESVVGHQKAETRHYPRRALDGRIEIVDREFDFVRAIMPYDYRYTCNAQQHDEAERICQALEGPMISLGVVHANAAGMMTAQEPAQPQPSRDPSLSSPALVGVAEGWRTIESAPDKPLQRFMVNHIILGPCIAYWGNNPRGLLHIQPLREFTQSDRDQGYGQTLWVSIWSKAAYPTAPRFVESEINLWCALPASPVIAEE